MDYVHFCKGLYIKSDLLSETSNIWSQFLFLEIKEKGEYHLTLFEARVVQNPLLYFSFGVFHSDLGSLEEDGVKFHLPPPLNIYFQPHHKLG